MTDLKSMTLEEITAALRAMGEPSFRGKQVFTWLHRGITDFDEMMNIPKSLREKLRAEYYITVPTVERGFLLVVFWSMEMAGDRPVISSTSGLSIRPRNMRA